MSECIVNLDFNDVNVKKYMCEATAYSSNTFESESNELYLYNVN